MNPLSSAIEAFTSKISDLQRFASMENLSDMETLQDLVEDATTSMDCLVEFLKAQRTLLEARLRTKRAKAPAARMKHTLKVRSAAPKATVTRQVRETVIAGWELGAKVGSGACVTVHAVEKLPTSLPKEDRGFPYVMKIAPSGRFGNMLYNEFVIYTRLRGKTDNVPTISKSHSYGKSGDTVYLAMERMSHTLMQELGAKGAFSDTKAADACFYLLDFYKVAHENNVVHVDIKPENYMYGLAGTETEDVVFCCDFGLSRSGGNTRKQTQQVEGTPLFFGTECHKGYQQSFKDDIEGLLYVMIFLMRGGELPWSHFTSDEVIGRMKNSMAPNVICSGLHPRWTKMLEMVRNGSPDEMPDYKALKSMLSAK